MDRKTRDFLWAVICILVYSLVWIKPPLHSFYDPIPRFPVNHKVAIEPVVNVQILENFDVTWYNDQGTTCTGVQTVAGRTVGVDPKIIPLGTWIEIHMPDGSILKRRAEDTGGAVKGRILDVYACRSDAELLKRGRTKGVTVVILGGV